MENNEKYKYVLALISTLCGSAAAFSGLISKNYFCHKVNL